MLLKTPQYIALTQLYTQFLCSLYRCTEPLGYWLTLARFKFLFLHKTSNGNSNKIKNGIEALKYTLLKAITFCKDGKKVVENKS